MPKTKGYDTNPHLVTAGLHALYSSYCLLPGGSEFELTENVKDFITGGDGVEANLQLFVEDCDKLSLYFYGFLGAHWLDGIYDTESHLFAIAWAANMLNTQVEEGDFFLTDKMIEPAIKAAARVLDLADVVWAIEDYALPFDTSSRSLRDDLVQAGKVLAKETAERDERLAALAIKQKAERGDRKPWTGGIPAREVSEV